MMAGAPFDIGALRSHFEKLYGKPARVFSAPGRVNLIGEHTDYNDGFVFPMSIDRRTFVAAAAVDEPRVRVRSLNFNEEALFRLDDERSGSSQGWPAYVEGVYRILLESSELKGADLAISSQVPIGAGLSSSAALEMSVGVALLSLSGRPVDLVQLALAGQKAEHVYVRTKSGIMDQLAVAFGQTGHALLIDCRSLQITPVRLKISDHAIVICNTKVKHELASSAYNERRHECEQGVELLRKGLPAIRALRDISVADLDKYKSLLPDTIFRRCRHVVTENERTLLAVEALQQGNTRDLGELMLSSHRSLRDDYEVSCAELDMMVEIAMSHDRVAGARMTGGGFGGCTVNLVQEDAIDSFKQSVAYAYERKTGIDPAIQVVEASDGVREDS
ncbi:MAG: galactokinase [Pyrinomonadaceae bacterium]